MITSAKNYTKINIKIRNKSVTESKPYVYICSQSLLPQFWVDSWSIQVFHRCRVPLVDCVDLIHCSSGCVEKFPFPFFFRTAPGFSFGFYLSSVRRLSQASVPTQTGWVKAVAD